MCYPRSMRRSTSPTGGYRLRMGPDIQFTSCPSHWKMNTNCTSRDPPASPGCGPYHATLDSKISFGLCRNGRGRTSETETPPPIIVELKADATPIRVKQYPMSHEAQRGIAPHIQWLLKAGILRRSIPIEYTPTTGAKARGNGFQASPGSS